MIRKTPTETRFYHQDALGSVVALTDETGFGYAAGAYDAWGDNYAAPAPARYGYTGREPDSAQRLVFYRERWYWPAFRRFISKDPLGLAGGINPYVYAGNSPTNFNDPMGLMPTLSSFQTGANNYFNDVWASQTFAGLHAQRSSVAPGPPDSFWAMVAQVNRPVQLQLPLGFQARNTTTAESLSYSHSASIIGQIRRYEPSFAYTILGSWSSADVRALELALFLRQAGMQSRVDALFGQLPPGRARDSHTALSITRALNPQNGQLVDFLTVNGGSSFQGQVREMAQREGLSYVRGFGLAHAEEIAVSAARERGLIPLVSHTPRVHCPGCFPMLLNSNVLPGTPPAPFSFVGEPVR